MDNFFKTIKIILFLKYQQGLTHDLIKLYKLKRINSLDNLKMNSETLNH
jgi:hypothetical protein